MKDAKRPEQGSIVSPNPLAEKTGKDGFPKQHQPWPGHERQLKPPADHGEETYEGAGKLIGRKVLITGGDSGIGRAVAIAMAREGADVAIAYFNEQEDAAETIKWIERAGRKGLAISGDLANRDHCREIVRQTVEEFGHIDVLVNNAAVHWETVDILDLTPEQFERTFRVNFFAYVWTAQAALEHMGEGGAIINTGSVVAMDGHPELIDYAATKAAIHNFSKSLAQMVAGRGIRVNVVAPGPVWTPLIASTRDPDHLGDFGKDTLWGRAAQPAEIAPAYVFLASPDSRYFTGEILAPTGLPTTTR